MGRPELLPLVGAPGLCQLRSSSATKRPSARAQLENLDEDTLAQLLAMRVETKKGGAPTN
jgi:hypothetical protein